MVLLVFSRIPAHYDSCHYTLDVISMCTRHVLESVHNPEINWRPKRSVMAAVAPTPPAIAAALGPLVERNSAPVANPTHTCHLSLHTSSPLPAPSVPKKGGMYGSVIAVMLLSNVAKKRPRTPKALPKDRPVRPVRFRNRLRRTR